MLRLSIESSIRSYDFQHILIFSDANDPVKGRFPMATVIPRKEGSEKLYGQKNIEEMHKHMKFASHDCDYILKKDSDILDCSSYAYNALNAGLWDCFGTFPMARKELIPDGHFNGNAYFIKSDIIKRFPMDISEESRKWDVLNCPEDMVTSSVCNKITKNIKIDGAAHYDDGFYLFDVFLSNIAAKDKKEIKKYGFAHCRSNFRVMDYLDKKIV